MRANEFLTEYKLSVSKDSDGVAIKATAGGKNLGHAEFFFNNEGQLDPQTVWVDERFHGQGIARDMYDHLKGMGYTIVRSWDQTPAGKGFWDKHRGEDETVWESNINELNYPDELNVSDALQQYFFKRGYQLAGEGRDQIAFESPRGTVVKVLGIGDSERENIVKRYVSFFLQHQNNPYYPRIYSTGDFTVGDETYFVYEMEYLGYISNEEEVLEYLEDLMDAVPRGPQALAAYKQNRPLPKSLPEDEIEGLIQATYQLEQSIGGHAPLDLSMIENLRRRGDGHIVIMDPYSL